MKGTYTEGTWFAVPLQSGGFAVGLVAPSSKARGEHLAMTTQSRLVDFQVFARAPGLAEGEQKFLNEQLFATFEPVRLWLKEHEVRAPFKKIAVSLSNRSTSARWHGNVSNAIGVCQVTEAVELAELRQHVGDHRWVLAIITHALACAAQSAGWHSEPLDQYLATTSRSDWPLIHQFERLSVRDDLTNVMCMPWLSTQPGKTEVGASIGTRRVTVMSEAGPIYLEDSFPLARSSIRDRTFLLQDVAGRTLAAVPIDSTMR
jgi:hypothetical protein